MKKKGLKEATQLYHVSSSPVNDTLLEISASPTNSTIPTPTGFAHPAAPASPQDDTNHGQFRIVAPFSEPSAQTSRVTHDRLSPRGELLFGPHASGASSKWRDRTADWVEMVERSGLTGLRGGGEPGTGSFYHRNPNFRRTLSFSDTKPQTYLSGHSRQFRERSMTQVTFPVLLMGFCILYVCLFTPF